MKKRLLVVAIIAGIFLIGTGAAYASDDAVPGDFLYSVDVAFESVQRSVISDPVVLADFEADVLAERVEELEVVSEDDNLDIVEEAAALVAKQSDKVREMEVKMEEECEGGNCDEGEKTRVVNRIMNEDEDHLQVMEQVQNKLEIKYGDSCSGACDKLIEVVESIETSTEGDDTDVIIEEDTIDESGGGSESSGSESDNSGGNGNK